jgi:hypothetical protein
MIIRILLSSLLIVFSVLDVAAQQSEIKLKARITLHTSISEALGKPHKSSFESEEKIFAALELTNESSEDVGLTTGQDWRYLRLRLERNGKAIPYKEERQNLLKDGSPHYSPVISRTLKPEAPLITDHVYLDEWYDKLEPGRYTVGIERIWGKQTFTSNQVEFDIVP